MIGAPDSNVSCAPIHAHKTLLSQGVSVQDVNRVGAQDSRYPAMTVLYTQHSSSDSKLESGEEQGP
jgi:predicted  nucleic acid-binding Zn ribbon protein